MKRIIMIVFLNCIIWSSCTNRNEIPKHPVNHVDVISKEAFYSRLIDSLNIRNLYNKTKWALYCLHCDDTVEFTAKSGIQDIVTYGSLDLNLDTIMLAGDSIEIDLRFYYQNLPCDVNLVYDTPIWGIRFTGNSDSANCYTTDGTARYFWTTNPDSRYLNLSHPDVIRYINANKEKLNPWFLEEAERRGLIR